ncbi:MAG: protein kinase [bacterium]
MYHRRWKTILAAKSPLPEVMSDESRAKRLMRETETWVDLGLHPNIDQSDYVRTIDRLPRIFIEYVQGGGLDQWFKEGKVKERNKIPDIAIQFCDEMDYPHGKGLIYGHVEPANVLMMKEGAVRITDFGLVKRGEDLPIERPTGRDEGTLLIQPQVGSLTVVAGGMGTPEYIAPEQWSRAKDVGAEADVYSFVVMLFELISGQRPFERAQDEPLYVLHAKHLTEAPPDLTSLRSDVPAIRHTGPVNSVCFSPDGTYDLSESGDFGSYHDKTLIF